MPHTIDSLPLHSLQYILSFISLTQLMELKLVSHWFWVCINDMTVTHLSLADVSADIRNNQKWRPRKRCRIVIRYDRIFKQFNHLTVIEADGLEVSMQLLIHYKHSLRKLSVGSLVMAKDQNANMMFERIQAISFTSLAAKDFGIISRFPKIREFRITKLDKYCHPLDQAFKLLPANLISLSCRVKCLHRLNGADFASTLVTLGLFFDEAVPYYETYGLKLPNLQNVILHQVTDYLCSNILLVTQVPRLRSLRVCPSSKGYPNIRYCASLLPGLEEYHISFQNIRVDRTIWNVPENWMKIEAFMTTKVLIIDSGYMTDSALEFLVRDERFPSLTRLQLTDPENEFSPAAVIQLLRSPVAHQLYQINIRSMMPISVTDASELKLTVEILSLQNLREAEITFSSMQSFRSFFRVIRVKPTGTRIANGVEKNPKTGLQVKSAENPLMTLFGAGNPGPNEMIRILNTIRDFEVSPRLRKYIRSRRLTGHYFYSLSSFPERMAELIEEGGLSREEASVLKRQVRGVGRVRLFKDSVLILWFIIMFTMMFALFVIMYLLA